MGGCSDPRGVYFFPRNTYLSQNNYGCVPTALNNASSDDVLRHSRSLIGTLLNTAVSFIREVFTLGVV